MAPQLGSGSRRRRRTLVSVLAALVAVLTALAACSSDGGGGGPASGKAGGKVNLTFWAWVPGIDSAVALWNRTHPNVQVKLSKIPSGSAGGYAKMRSALKAGNAPDLAQVEYQEIPSFLLDDSLMDLTKYGANDVENKFVPWQWAQGKFGDAVYAIPQASGPMAFYYRKDVFQKLGIAPPATWAEYAAAAQKIHASNPNTYIGTFPPGNAAWFTSLAWQAGAQWFGTSGDTWKVGIDTPTTRKVAAYWDDLRTRKLIKTEPDFANGWYSDLQKGNVVGWVSASWGDAILSGNAPKTAGKWAVAKMPQWKAGENVSANWGGSSTAVLKGSEHPTVATEFATWLNSDPKSIDLLIKGGYGWPAATDAFQGTTLDQPSAFFGGQKYNDIFADADKHIDTSWKWIPTIDQTYQRLQDGFNDAVNGKGSFVQAVQNAQGGTVSDMKGKGLKVTTE